MERLVASPGYIREDDIHGDNVGSGFPTILNAWEEQGWETPELIEDTVLNQVTLVLKMKQEKVAKKSGEKKWRKKGDEKNFRKSNVDFGQYAAWCVV